MKSIILTGIGICSFTALSFAQQINGKILLNKNSKNTIELGSPDAVELYAQLRANEMPVNFIFEGTQLPKTTSGKEVALIQFRTTIKYNGKEIASMKRSPIPFFPGDMFMPVETFDIIPILVLNTDKRTAQDKSRLAPGKYEVILEAIPIDTKGAIKPATLVFEVR